MTRLSPLSKLLIATLTLALVTGACRIDSPPSVATTLPRDLAERPQGDPAAGEVVMFVSNQSFADSKVSIAIIVDDTVVVDDIFDVGDQHEWMAFSLDDLEPGVHTLEARSGTQASFAGTFTVLADEPLWLVINYWNYPGNGDGRYFSFNESDEPVEFA